MTVPAYRLESRQNQVLTPRMQQAVRLLQLSTQDYAQELQQALLTNPFLEMEESVEEDQYVEEPIGETKYDSAVSELPVDDARIDIHDDSFDLPPDGESWGVNSRAQHDGNDDDFNMLDLAHANVTLHDHLHGQLRVLNLSPREQLLTALVVEALDDDGYLRVSLDDLCSIAELESTVEDSELQFALNMVQSLDPSGIACRDLQECLRLQLKSKPDCPARNVAIRIIDEQFKLLAQHNINGIANALALKPADIEQACDYIRHLDPHPGLTFGNPPTAYISPDVIVTKVNGRWSARLNQAVMPKLRLNQLYIDLFQKHRESHHGQMATYLQDAHWTLRNLEQRFSTILCVAQEIVNRQQNFFEHGALAMQPLGLKDIAEALEVHESTVSRTTNNKYMATPLGVFELKYFFSRALNTDQGSSCSTIAIRRAIKEMIQAEDPKAPLSDAEITRQLTQLGLQVARRTVTKYRQMMNIPALDMRRKHG